MCVFARRYASSVKDGSQYFVLLIITDGVISDMAQTKESIVNVSAPTAAVGEMSIAFMNCFDSNDKEKLNLRAS